MAELFEFFMRTKNAHVKFARGHRLSVGGNFMIMMRSYYFWKVMPV